MRKISLEEIKKRELDILSWIDNICKENNIKYYLAYGTLLGAVRHKGFIPRDDDIDIYMPRDDYNRFIFLARKYKNAKFSLLALETDARYYYPFAKVVDSETYVDEKMFKKIDNLGVRVDIFPLDYYSQDAKMRKKIERLCSKHLVSRYNKYVKSSSALRNLVKMILYFGCYKYMNPRKYAIQIQNLSIKGNDLSKYTMTFAERGHFDKEVYDKEFFADTVLLQFEDKESSAPAKFDNILTQNYGDYLVLPPKKDRISNHVVDAFIK